MTTVKERIAAITNATKNAPTLSGAAPAATAPAAPVPAQPVDTEPRPGRIDTLIEAQGAFVRCYPVANLIGPGNRPIAAIGIRLNRKREEDAAVVAAHKYAARITADAGDARDAALRDMDLLGDAKVVQALWRACREVVDPNDLSKGIGKHPAFPTDDWMREHLTTDQLAMLMNLYTETRRAAYPERWDLSEERMEALLSMAAKTSDTDIPEVVLAPYAREQVTHAFVYAAERLAEARTSLETLFAEVDARDATIAALRAEVERFQSGSPAASEDERAAEYVDKIRQHHDRLVGASADAPAEAPAGHHDAPGEG
ncbi:MAG: hypothetical protein E6R03_02585 [Hyphomicrobiaceae bacterium]|nr:MAG: hypothetical protein E6R03_02585 [Hyphomicrobiaceae bacterium]